MKNQLKDVWNKVIESLSNFFNFNKEEKVKLIEETKEDNTEIEIPESKFIRKAKNAFETYALADDPEETNKICNTLIDRLDENESAIRRVLELTHEEIEYEDIVNILKGEMRSINEYKKTIFTQKVDEQFIYQTYQVPVGIIAIETDDTKKAVENMFKAIVTRNAIILVQSKNNKYRIEKLLLMIIGECLKKYNLDSDLIQILVNDNIPQKQVDLYISKEDQTYEKKESDVYYIYKEDSYFASIVKEEKEKLLKLGKNVEVLEGNFYDTVDIINKNKIMACAIYTKDRKIGYKFINLINADNVYMNATLESAEQNEQLQNIYYRKKNIVYEYK